MMPIKSEYPQSKLAGTVTVVGDIVAPVLPEEGWESLAPVTSPPPPETPA